MLKKSHILHILYDNYASIPIKASSLKTFNAAYETLDLSPHALSWPKITENVDWG